MADPAVPDSSDSGALLLSDAERLHALTVLGDHYAAGRLDDPEFHARSGDVAVARTLSQLKPSFHDLPGGTPLESVDGVIVQAAIAGGGQAAFDDGQASAGTGLVPASSSSLSRPSTSAPSPRDPDADLNDLRRRGKLAESMNGIIVGLTLVAFLVLQFVVGWDHAWIVWPSLALTMSVPNLILRYSDSDKKVYDKLKRSDEKAREERLLAANERIRELGDGREKHD